MDYFNQNNQTVQNQNNIVGDININFGDNHSILDRTIRTLGGQIVKEQLIQKRRRLNILKQQAARLGYSVDAAILMEIEDIESDIKMLEQQL